MRRTMPRTILNSLCHLGAEAFEPSEGFRGLILERGGSTIVFALKTVLV